MKKIFLILSAICLLLPACSKNTGQNYSAYYPECREPILEMEGQSSRIWDATKGAAVGGVGGGAVGFLLGLLLDGGNVAQAGIDAAVGAATGAIAGGVSQGLSGGTSEQEENRLLAKYYKQIGGNVSGLTVRQAAGMAAFQCYRNRKKELAEMIGKGSITPIAAEQRKAAINQGMHAAMSLIGEGETPLPGESHF